MLPRRRPNAHEAPVKLDSRSRKEIYETIQTHEEIKLRLKSYYDREIEEVVTQIRRNYEIELQETEAEFMTKKEVLDASLNRVLMSKILADAFQSKCTDLEQFSMAVQQGGVLDANQNKVFMNKILADAFQFKCTDLEQFSTTIHNSGTSDVVCLSNDE
ncbi:hypothetical protein Q3G72_029870 [Acer saccharum]|nr:hypothetical protein Q3G72_029870 [Acer saccharum]